MSGYVSTFWVVAWCKSRNRTLLAAIFRRSLIDRLNMSRLFDFNLLLVHAWGIQARILRRIRDNVFAILSYVGLWHVPPTATRRIISTQWLSRVLGATVLAVDEDRLSEDRGFVGKMLVLQVRTFDNPSLSLVLKSNRTEVSERLVGFGAVREAFFYRSIYARRMADLGRIPKTYFCSGSQWLGELVLLMENLDTDDPGKQYIAVNQLMGNQIWGVAADTPGNVDKLELLKALFYHAAELHAQYWMNESLLREGWMRNTNWFHGRGRHYWEWTMECARQGWEKIRLLDQLQYPENFVAIVDASFTKSSWSQMQEHLQTSCYTLTHGDFHAANMRIQLPLSPVYTADQLLEGLKVFDWSEVGPWEPTTDLAQTVISDLPKELFKGVEGCLRAYHLRLLELGVEDYSWEECRRRFGESGVERWIWVLGVMSSLFDITSNGCCQYFINQIDSFRLEFCPNQTHFILKSAGCLLPN